MLRGLWPMPCVSSAAMFLRAVLKLAIVIQTPMVALASLEHHKGLRIAPRTKGDHLAGLAAISGRSAIS